jgi:hypothetical protein
LKVPFGIRKGNLCQHPGCQKEGLPCYSASGDEESNGFYCFDHCQVHGFCYPCDLSWGGMEFFGFTNDLCVNCREDLDAEFGEDEVDFDRKIFDKIFDHEERLKYYRGELPEEVSHCDPFPQKISLRCYYLKAK